MDSKGQERFLSLTGYTLVEAILTILIMGILAAVVLPHFVKEGFLGDLTLRTTASGITSDMRYTRQLAITDANSSIHYLIKFNFTQKQYNIYNTTIAPANQIGETKKISSNITCTGTDQFDFSSFGNCEICISNGGVLNLFLGSHQYQISVDPPTGAAVSEKIS